MNGFIIVFFGAGIGGMLRHAVHVVATVIFGTGIPHATAAINIAGSLVMGLLVGWFAQKAGPGHSWQLFLATGVLGGFTTFSTFSLDAALLWQRGQPGLALAYILSSVVLAVLGLFAGLLVVQHLA